MIEYRTGNVLDAPAGSIIVHGCNAAGVMGSGVALAVKKRYPEAFEVYLREFYVKKLTLGEITYYKTPDQTTIVNGITQQTYGTYPQRYVDYEAVSNVFERIVRDASFIHPQSVLNVVSFDYDAPQPYVLAFPKIGAGLGGGSWDVISAIIDEAVPDTWKKVCYEL